MVFTDLDEVDGPGESRLIGVRRVARGDHDAPGRVHPALGDVVHVLASHDLILSPATDTRPDRQECRWGH